MMETFKPFLPSCIILSTLMVYFSNAYPPDFPLVVVVGVLLGLYIYEQSQVFLCRVAFPRVVVFVSLTASLIAYSFFLNLTTIESPDERRMRFQIGFGMADWTLKEEARKWKNDDNGGANKYKTARDLVSAKAAWDDVKLAALWNYRWSATALLSFFWIVSVASCAAALHLVFPRENPDANDPPASPEGLIKVIGCGNVNRLIDVVFVHGLDGDSKSTWHPQGSPESYWPRWLGEDETRIGVWSLGYAVTAMAWRGQTMPLTDRATNSLDLLSLDNLGDRPIVFVCHSLGGLLVKQMLRHAMDRKDPRERKIAEQTRGIVFLSTPHSGSDIASWLRHIETLLRATVTLDELQAHDGRLRELNLWFRNHSHTPNIKLLSYCEKRPFLGVIVVNEDSADLGIAGMVPIPMDDDHFTICKPISRDAQVYRGVLRFIRDIIEANATAEALDETALSNVKNTQGIAQVVAIEFTLDCVLSEFDETKFRNALSLAAGLDAKRARIVSLRSGSTIVCVEADRDFVEQFVDRLQSSKQVLHEFIRHTQLRKVEWSIDGTVYSLSVEDQGNSLNSRLNPTPGAGSPANSAALTVWKDKLAFLLAEEAIAADPALRFYLQHHITEAKAKIKELGGQP